MLLLVNTQNGRVGGELHLRHTGFNKRGDEGQRFFLDSVNVCGFKGYALSPLRALPKPFLPANVVVLSGYQKSFRPNRQRSNTHLIMIKAAIFDMDGLLELIRTYADRKQPLHYAKRNCADYRSTSVSEHRPVYQTIPRLLP